MRPEDAERGQDHGARREDRAGLLDTAEFGAAPAATPEQPHPRPSVKPGTFKLLVIGK